MNNDRKLRLEKRKLLQQKVELEKARNAGVVPQANDSSGESVATLPTDSLVIYSNHFVIETQADENGDDCYAVYRLLDLASVMPHDGATPEPVHVFDMLVDASNFVGIMDSIVARSEPESVGVELGKVVSTPTTDVTQ